MKSQIKPSKTRMWPLNYVPSSKSPHLSEPLNSQNTHFEDVGFQIVTINYIFMYLSST